MSVATPARGAVFAFRPIAGTLLGLALWLGLSGCVSAPKTSEAQRESAAIHFQLGVEHLRRGQMQQAESSLQRSLELDGRSADTYTVMGVLYQQTRRPAEAERALRRALALAPDNAAVQNNLGVFLCDHQQREEGEQWLVRAAQSPRYATPEAAWTNASVCVRAESASRAEGYLRQALAINPQYADALMQMAAITFHQRDYLRSRAFLQRHEATAEPMAETLLIRSRVEAALGDAEAAQRYRQQLRASFPESIEAEQAFSE